MNNRSFFSEKLFAWAIAMLRAEERVLKGEEWSSEKEAAWSKDFFFIQVLTRVNAIHSINAVSPALSKFVCSGS